MLRAWLSDTGEAANILLDVPPQLLRAPSQ